MKIKELNHRNRQDFISALQDIYENSPWVAEKTHDLAPFVNLHALKSAMEQAVDHASPEQQLALILAHPDLGGKLGIKRHLTNESTREQASLGLDQLNESEYQEFTELNQAYRDKFGFPLIICVGLVKNRSEILSAFKNRILLEPEEEKKQALRQIHLIASLRLSTLIEDQ